MIIASERGVSEYQQRESFSTPKLPENEEVNSPTNFYPSQQ